MLLPTPLANGKVTIMEMFILSPFSYKIVGSVLSKPLVLKWNSDRGVDHDALNFI